MIATDKPPSPSGWQRLSAELERTGKLPDGFIQGMVGRLEYALASTKKQDLSDAATALEAMVHTAIARAPESVKSTVLGWAEADAAIEAAYLLGQLSFAQHLASHAFSHRAEDSFAPAILSPENRTLMLALLKDGQSPATLLALPNLPWTSPETLQAHLDHLGELGVVYWRYHGTTLNYELTPAARGLLRHTLDLVAAFKNNTEQEEPSKDLNLPTPKGRAEHITFSLADSYNHLISDSITMKEATNSLRMLRAARRALVANGPKK